MLDKDKSIMVISTTCLEVPPPNYGGVERMVYNLSKELGSRGYDVRCVAPQGTQIPDVDIIETIEPMDSTDCFKREPEAYGGYAHIMPEVDVVIDHSWQKWSYIGKKENPSLMEDTSIMGVWHGMPSVKEKPPVENPCYMSVSKAAARAWQNHTGMGVRFAYNGIDLDNYPLRDSHFTEGDYYLTLNRIMKEKGIHEFIQICEDFGEEYIVAGEDTFVDDPGYVHDAMRMCHQSDLGTYLGTVDQEKKIELLRNAKATVLLPMHGYQEVFGLAAAESMACGTPVICMANNGLGEVASKHQMNGVCNDLSEVSIHMQNVSFNVSKSTSIEGLREVVEEHFSKEVMADMYLQDAEDALEEPW